MKTQNVDDYISHTAFNPVYDLSGQLLAVELVSSFEYPATNVVIPQEMLLPQLEKEQRLPILQKQISTIEKYHAFLTSHHIAVTLNIDEMMAQTILSSDFILHKMGLLSALDLGVDEGFTGFKQGKENPLLRALKDKFTLTLNNFGSGKAPAKAVYDNLFSRIKLDKYFFRQTMKRASYRSVLTAITSQINDHCQQFIVQGVDDIAMLENIYGFAISGVQGALFPPVPDNQLAMLIETPGGFSDSHC